MDDRLLNLLVCPITKKPLKKIGDTLVSEEFSYDIIDGIPVLLKEKARRIDNNEGQLERNIHEDK